MNPLRNQRKCPMLKKVDENNMDQLPDLHLHQHLIGSFLTHTTAFHKVSV